MTAHCTVPYCDWQNLYKGFPGKDERERREHIWMAHGGYGE